MQKTYVGPMARVKLIVSQHSMTRLVSPDMILGRYTGRWGSTQKETRDKNDVSGGIVSPTTTSDVSDNNATEEES